MYHIISQRTDKHRNKDCITIFRTYKFLNKLAPFTRTEEEEEKKKPVRRKTRNSHFAVGPGVQSAF